MTTARKHMERSHRNHQKDAIPVAIFASRAAVRKEKKATQEYKSLFQKVMHRTQDK